jgi:tryptophan synthase alpha chain
VSLKGVTGAGHLDIEEVARRIAGHIRQKVGMPVGVGFGIRDAESAGAFAKVADAVVIGSRIIEEIERSPRDQATAARQGFPARGIRGALDELAVARETIK